MNILTITKDSGRVVNMHVNETVLDTEKNVVDLHKLKPVSRGGGNTYISIGNTFDMARPKA